MLHFAVIRNNIALYFCVSITKLNLNNFDLFCYDKVLLKEGNMALWRTGQSLPQ